MRLHFTLGAMEPLRKTDDIEATCRQEPLDFRQLGGCVRKFLGITAMAPLRFLFSLRRTLQLIPVLSLSARQFQKRAPQGFDFGRDGDRALPCRGKERLGTSEFPFDFPQNRGTLVTLGDLLLSRNPCRRRIPENRVNLFPHLSDPPAAFCGLSPQKVDAMLETLALVFQHGGLLAQS